MLQLHRTARRRATAFLVPFAAVLAAASFAAAKPANHASPNDTARFLAGLPLPDSSPLAQAAKGRYWQAHAKRLDTAWTSMERRQLAKIRKWSEENITSPAETLFYPFSGPDFLYAETFFPKAKTYVLMALEPVGTVPDLVSMSDGRRSSGIGALQSSINTILNVSFFRTNEMMVKFRQQAFPGALPVVLTFVARAGNVVEDIELLVIGEDGIPKPAGEKQKADGAKIVFSTPGKEGRRSAYYFSTNVSDPGLKSSGFLSFLKSLAPGDGFIKSASYLPHRSHFADIRKFLLENTKHIVQDDTGIPLSFYKENEWDRLPFGNYNGPISIFSKYYQRDMRALFQTKARKAIDFGIGYRYRPGDSGFLLSVKK
ncbi:MAG: hypothetical protein AB7E80_06325 [Hyphomicrobiaceae bacterium]